MSENRVFIHSAALVETEKIGEGTRVWAFAHVLKGAIVGRECNIGEHAYIESGAKLGDGVVVKNGAMIWDGVVIEDGVFIGPGVLFTNDRKPRARTLPDAKKRYADGSWRVSTCIKKGASLGAGSVMLCGITVGEYAMVAAGAVVTRSVPAHALMIGHPAVRTGWVCRCGGSLVIRNDTWSCERCGISFKLEEGIMHPM